jgi:glycosyltransferase domain-containing protein
MRQRLSEIAQGFRPAFGKSKQDMKAAAEAQVVLPRISTLLDLANETDSLLAFEINNGCLGPVDQLIDDLRKTILENKVVYAPSISEDDAVERLWINLLRLGLFDELLHLVNQLDLPLRTEARTFADFCAREYDASKKRGEAYRARHPNSDIFTMGCIVWGNEYVGNFLRYNLRSMLSENNLPALGGQGQVVFSIVTDAAGERHIRQHPMFGKLAEIADFEFIMIPDEMIGILSSGHLVRNFYILYGMLDHCSIFFAQGAASHLFMIPVDSIVADGSLNNMANYRHEGYECCGGGNVVANTETFLPALDMRYGDDDPISISTEDLATLAVEHAHHYFTSQIVATENEDFGKHPRELFWPVDGGVEIHSVFIHPLFTTASGLANYRRMHFANIDYGMVPRLFSDSDRIKIIEDPRQAYVNNFTARGRLYETTGKPFAVADFLGAHNYSYTVQKSLFKRPQTLPCRLKGWTPYRDVTMDVREISARLTIAGRSLGNSGVTTESDLTIILPTRNRVDLCKAQVRFLQRWGIRHRVVVADSSDLPDDGLREACTGLIEYRRFDPETLPDIKLAVVARSVTTPYVAMMTDDDISFPHTIDACLDYLRRNPDTVVAQGYVLGFSAIERNIDIHSMQWFIGTIAEPTPLRRLYELMRRYQPFFWAAFRTDVYVRAIEAANAAKGTFFQELAFTATVSLLGNAARLPMIQTLRGDEESHTPAAESHPFFWFLKDARLFFNTYARYRDGLVDLLHELDTGRPPKRGALFRLARLLRGDTPAKRGPEDPSHVIDIIHATYFGREVDTGKINHTARILLGDPVGPVPLPKPAERNLEIGPGDLMHPSSIPERRYVWRDAVFNAEPRSEITISPEEIARVEAALDIYLPPIASVSEVLTEPLIAREAEQRATAENVSLQRNDGNIRVTETSGYGYHRLLGKIDGGAAGQTVTISVLAKPVGCSTIKIELHDGGVGQYVSCTFDLKSGEKSSWDGPVVHSDISPAEDGYFHLSLSLVPMADGEIHFTVAFLNADNVIVYPGRAGKAVLLRKIDIEGLLSSASVSEELTEPLIAREVKQSATAENVALQSNDGAIRVTETRGYGYHRLLARIDGGCAGKVATLSLLAKPVGCWRVKIELRDDGAAQYVTSTFDLKSGDKLSSDGPLVQCSISPAEDGYFHLSLGLVPAVDTQIHFTVTFLNADNAIVYRGRQERAVLLRKIDIQ